MTDQMFEGAPQEAPTPQPQPQPSPLQPQPSSPGAPSPAELELKWNGQTQRVPLDRARELAQMGYDYTQKMQQLAREREQIGQWTEEKQRYEQAIQEVRAFLQDRQRLQQYLQSMGGVDPEGGVPTPEGLTPQQVQEMLQRQQQQLAQMTTQQITQLEVKQMATQYRQEFDAHLQGLTAQLPELQELPGVDRLIKEDVAQMRPRNSEEAKQMLADVARNYAHQIRERRMNLRKTQPDNGGAGASLKQIEPPGGGTGPMPQQPSGFYKGKLTDPAWKSLVMGDMERIMKGALDK